MGAQATAAADSDGVTAAHRQLLADGSTQFALPPYHAPEPPAWAKALADWLHHHAAQFAALGPVVKYAFWGGLAILVGLLLVSLYRWLAPLLRRDHAEPPILTGWRPDPAPARALLAEADALAAHGQFAAAARLVLLRSVEQIADRSEGLAPALTSRDIARSSQLPRDVATAFAAIAEVVETGLFAARPVGAEAWTRVRTSYEGVAFPAAWA